MANVAILIGNSEYQKLNGLGCCSNDIVAMNELLNATQRFDRIEIFENYSAHDLKENLRASVSNPDSVEELFFYFTGHGHQGESDFFYCATDFDGKRPNETGLATTDLHQILQLAKAGLVVKVIDACNSGTLLIKSEMGFRELPKSGFNTFIQIASCLDSQNSLAGYPLSLFTEKFRLAALKKTEGVVYYSNLIDTLRDDFQDHASQTPHFVQQGTGLAQFVDEATKFDDIRLSLKADQVLIAPVEIASENTNLSFVGILQQREKSFANKDIAQGFITNFFDTLTAKVSLSDSLLEAYSEHVVMHPAYQAPSCHAFLVRVLMAEKRPDKFVTVTTTKKKKKPNPLSLALSALAFYVDDDEFIETHRVNLNCELEKVQLNVTLIPKFRSLNRWTLVVSCVPSLEYCFVFEMLTEHHRSDWDSFDEDGVEMSRRWYQLKWADSSDSVTGKISEVMSKVVLESIKKLVDAE